MASEYERGPNFQRWKALKIEEFKERHRSKCIHYHEDGCGGYCKLRPQDPPVHGHIYYRTFCFGNKGTFCVEPDGYKEVT